MILIAINYNNTNERVSMPLRSRESVRIGRRPESIQSGSVFDMALPWSDRLVSRNHCSAVCDGDTLVIQRLPPLPGRGKPNMLYSNTKPREREALKDPITLKPGDSVVIGNKGNTAIFWVKSESEVDAFLATSEVLKSEEEDPTENYSEAPIKQQNYDEVEQLDEYSLKLQLKLLQSELPQQVLSGWTNRRELFSRAAAFIENALPGQKGVTAAFLAVDRNEDGEIFFERLHRDAVDRPDFNPSLTLLDQLEVENPVPSNVHVWNSAEHLEQFRSDSLGEKIDWVMAVPVAPMDDEGEIHRDRDQNRPVYLYIETRQATEHSAPVYLPFVRLIGSLIASLLSARDQQLIQDRMSTFFSPGLRQMMRDGTDDSLQPTMADCTIMFADRRGSSHLLENAKTDKEILDRLKENQEVVGTITDLVFKHKGVITDFAGDGALSLWGWPNIGVGPETHALLAVESAQAIVESLADRGEYEEEHGRFMSAIRLGVSTGRLAVGKTGPTQQWHISVFGGVANLGARLERIAKEFKVPLLISDETYQRVKNKAGWTFRKLCLITPAGFEESYPIYELVLDRKLGGSGADEKTISAYETALDYFVNRNWDASIDLLNTLPKEDEPTTWLRDRAEIMRINPPGPNWKGEISSLSK